VQGAIVVNHIIFRAFRDDVTEEQISTAHALAARFVEIDGIESVVAGPNLGIAPMHDGFTHAVVISARDADAIRVFLAHPLHKESNDFSAPLTARRVILTIEG
jgi:hypothetical protein